MSADELCRLYHGELKCVLDSWATQKSSTITIRPEAGWYTEEIRQAKQMRRRAERAWRKSGLTVHKEIFMEKKQTVNNLLWRAKLDHYKGLIEEHKDDTKQLFRITNHLLGRNKVSPLRSGSDINIANMYSEYFV